jgi:serine/threonine protein kinase/tetratricopeptide (TPR) repeat protein
MTERELFLQALDIEDPAERAEFLDRECAGEPDLRRQVEVLLKAHEQAGQFLDQPHPAAGAGPQTGAYVPDSSAETAGTIVAGKYKLLQRIGEGGMGSVWMADQTEPVKRRVAVKLIRAERDGSRTILSRFEAERQAIALMDHPNIAKLLDAGATEGEPDGTSPGRPYFVMELVKGIPLTAFCDEHKLSVPHRLNLFMQICSAVQHAHQKGIIHRDLKPTNILVELHDDKPVPKVIDFGLAKALSGQPLSDHTLFTGFGTVAGTPLYMAPEQAKFNAIDIDTRADIYALGVILYELLTGSTPIERAALKQAAFDEILRVIRESEPPTPSKRLSSTDSTPSVAANRQSEPQKLGRFVRGDLDWIVMKALAKERDRRYETANGFAKDIERFLNHEPVLAGPPSTGYRMRKFVRRNRGQVVAALAICVVLVAGIAGTTVGLIRSEAARRGEREQRAIAQANEKQATVAATAEKKAKEREAEQRSNAEKARDRTRQALDAMTSSITGDSLSAQTEISEDQKKFLTEVLKYYQEFAGEKADDEKSRARTAAAAVRVGIIESRLGRTEQALAAYQMARVGYASLATDFPSKPAYRQALGVSHMGVAIRLRDLGKFSEAKAEFGNALAIQEKLVDVFPATPSYRAELARTQTNLAVLLADQGNYREAEQLSRQALAAPKKLAAEFPAEPEHREELAILHHNLGVQLWEMGKRSEAVEQERMALAIDERLAADFPTAPKYRHSLAGTRYGLGHFLMGLGKASEADEQFRQAMTIQDKLAAEFPGQAAYREALARTHHNRGNLLTELAKSSEAEAEFRQALAIREKLSAESPGVAQYRRGLASSHVDLGTLLEDMGRRREAERAFRQAVAILEALAADVSTVPDIRLELALSQVKLASVLGVLGNRFEAEERLRRAISILKSLTSQFPVVPRYQHHLVYSHLGLGAFLTKVGRPIEAEEQYRRALTIQQKLTADFAPMPRDLHKLARSHDDLGVVLVGMQKRLEAEEQHRQALAILEKLVTDCPTVSDYRLDLARSHHNLGKVLKEQGNHADAERHYRQALAIQEQLVADFAAVPRHREQLASKHRSLGILLSDLGKLTEAEKQFRQALAINEKLAVDFPAMLEYRIDLGSSYCNVGHIILDGGRPRESLDWYDKAMRTLTPVYEQDHGAANAKEFLCNSHRGRAEAFDALQKHDQAVKDWNRVAELSPKSAIRAAALARADRIAEATAEADELTKSSNWNANGWYDIACVYAIAGGQSADKKQEYAGRAMELLRIAVKHGWKDAALMVKDHDLDSLRDRDDFKKLLADLGEKPAPMKEPAQPAREKQ